MWEGGKDIAEATFALNNVNHRILDLYPAQYFFCTGVTIRLFVSLHSNPRADFWRLFWCTSKAARSLRDKGSFSSFLTIRIARRHNFCVPAPATKTLGDVLYADKAKPRQSEDEWLLRIRAVAEGDQRALYFLYEQTHRIVFTLIVRILMNRETAEEVTLDVFYEVWRRASSYDPANGSVVGWIMNQARSRAIDRLRFDHRKKRVNAYPHSLGPTTDIVDPRQAYLFEERSRLLRDALEVLTPDERKTIETAFFSDLTYEQTARKLNQPLGTVKTRIRSGLGKLREALKGY